MNRILILVAATLFISATAVSAASIQFTISGMLKKALHNNPLLVNEQLKIRKAKLQLESVRHKALLPTLNFDVQFGVVPESDQEFIDGLGPFTRFELKALQPLYTFGKVGYARELAGYGIDEARVKAKLVREKLVLQTIRMFWNLRAANKGQEIAEKLRKEYRKLLEEVKRDSRKKESDITAVDLLNVRSSSFVIEQQYHSAVEAVRKISAVIRIFLQLQGNAPLSTEAVSFPDFDYKKFNVNRALAFGSNHRPELRALQFASTAAVAQLNLARSMRYPDFFIAAGGRIRWAGKRPDDDDYNDKGLGAFLGLRWKLNFWQANDGVKKARISFLSFKEKSRQLQARIALEIREAHSRLIKEFELLFAVRKSLKNSRTWYRLAGDNWEMGLGKLNEFIKSYTTYFKLERATIKQELACGEALARLAYVIGDTKLTLRWLKYEKITF